MTATERKKVYLSSGRGVELIQDLDDGKFLVRGVYEMDDVDDFGDFCTGDELLIVDEVFDAAPTQMYDEKILKLKAEIGGLESAKHKAAAALRGLEKDCKAAIEKHREKFKALNFLNDFLDGKLTHYVITGWGAEIHSMNDKEMKNSSYDEPFKLVTLFGDSPRDGNRSYSRSYSGDLNLNWRINQYRDGSGSWRDMIPCTSLEHAKEELKKHIDERMESGKIPAEIYVNACIENDIECPQKYLDEAKTDELEKQDNRSKKLKLELEKLDDVRKLIEKKYKEKPEASS